MPYNTMEKTSSKTTSTPAPRRNVSAKVLIIVTITGIAGTLFMYMIAGQTFEIRPSSDQRNYSEIPRSVVREFTRSHSRRTSTSKPSTASSRTEEADNVQPDGAVGESMNIPHNPVEAGLVSDEKVQGVQDVPGNPEAVQEEKPEGLTDDETRNSKARTTRIQEGKNPAAPKRTLAQRPSVQAVAGNHGAVLEEKPEIITPNKPGNNGTIKEQKKLIVPETPVNSNKIKPEVKQQPSSVVEIDEPVPKPVSTNATRKQLPPTLRTKDTIVAAKTSATSELTSEADPTQAKPPPVIDKAVSEVDAKKSLGQSPTLRVKDSVVPANTSANAKLTPDPIRGKPPSVIDETVSQIEAKTTHDVPDNTKSGLTLKDRTLSSGATRPDVAKKPDMATKPKTKPRIPARFPELILTGDKIEVDKVVTRVHMASQKSGINSTKLTLLRKNFMNFFNVSDLRNEFMMTQQNSHVNDSFDLFKYKGAQPIPLSPAVFKLLPDVSPFGVKYFNTCSIVGSSGILSKSGCGRIIDQSDFVFRMNEAKTANFEADVGATTNITTLNGGLLTVSHTRVSCLATSTPFQVSNKYLWLRLPASHKNKVTKLTGQGCQVFKKSEGQVLFGNPMYSTEVVKYWRQYGIADQRGTTVTSGLYVLTAALSMCNHTNLYGFYPFSTFTNGRKVPYHYFNNRRMGPTHTWSKEFEMLLRLHDARLIDLHFTCDKLR